MWIASTHHQQRLPTAFLPFPPLLNLCWCVLSWCLFLEGGGGGGGGGGGCVVCYEVMHVGGSLISDIIRSAMLYVCFTLYNYVVIIVIKHRHFYKLLFMTLWCYN